MDNNINNIMNTSHTSFKVYLSNNNSRIPTKAHNNDAGFDLHSVDDVIIPSWSRKLVSVGLRVAIPEGYYGRIASRSSMSLRGIDSGAGVIDSGYRSDIKVLLINNSDDDFHVYIGNKIAQLIIEKIYTQPLQVVEKPNDLGESHRGERGFGSSGR